MNTAMRFCAIVLLAISMHAGAREPTHQARGTSQQVRFALNSQQGKSSAKPDERMPFATTANMTLPIIIHYSVDGQAGTVWMYSDNFKVEPPASGSTDGAPRITLYGGWLIFEGVAPHVSTETVEMAGTGGFIDKVAKDVKAAHKKHKFALVVAGTKDICYVKSTESDKLVLKGTIPDATKPKEEWPTKEQPVKSDDTYIWEHSQKEGNWCPSKEVNKPVLSGELSRKTENEAYFFRVFQEKCPP